VNCVAEIEFDVISESKKLQNFFLVGCGAVKSCSGCLASCIWPSKLHATETQEQYDGFFVKFDLWEFCANLTANSDFV